MDLGEFAKNLQSLKIEEGDKMIELKFTLQKKLSIKVEEELKILVASNMREDRKLVESVSTKQLTGSDVSCCSKSMIKSPRKIFFRFSLLSLSNNDSII